MKQQPNPFNQTYALGDTDTQAQLLVSTLRAVGASSAEIVRAVERMAKRVGRFYNGTSKYNGNGELKNV